MASLWEALKQYVSDAAPGGVLSPETPRLGSLLDYGKQKAQYIGGLLDPNSQVSQDVGSWHKKTQLGLADLLAGKETPAADYGYGQMMNMAGVAPLGLTAWHGSPHKFDKFSLDKIGTGEGAQAYGHGLYLAESPEVANQYSHVLTKNAAHDGKPVYELDTSIGGRRETEVRAKTIIGSDARGPLPGYYTPKGIQSEYSGPIAALKDLIDKGLVPKKSTKWLDDNGIINVSSVEPQLYKTDIPDEAVARFLDWDKPLSQQAPEVQAALKRAGYRIDDSMTGADVARGTRGSPSDEITSDLHANGITGIRYLDGGSRSAGNGTSNFVVFSPDLIRILERNGIATGEKPWAPGEWSGLLGR